MPEPRDPVLRQRAFYDEREHTHLRARDCDFYAEKLSGIMADRLGITREHRVLEVGAGFGRFTFPLLERCRSVHALDVSPRVLERLEEERDRRGISAARCTPLCLAVDEIDPAGLDERFDVILGFFILHHLPSFERTISILRQLLVPAGRMGFLEPNRRNPLFLAQVACCADMTWREERGMFRLSAAAVESAFRSAGLVPNGTETFGFFPPQVLNNLPRARTLEARLESATWLRAVRPFLALTAAVPESGAD